jgi:hypothetical protein
MKYWFVLLLVLTALTPNAPDFPIAFFPQEYIGQNYVPESGMEYSPFFLLNQSIAVDYSPIVLIPDYDWYINNSLNYYSETYVAEIKINETFVDLSSYAHEDLVAVGVDWHVSGYGMHSYHNLSYFVYSDPYTLLANDTIEIEIQLDEQPQIDYSNSRIEIGIQEYHHIDYPNDFKYTIYPNGLVLYSIYLTDETVTYEGWIKDEKYIELLDLIWSYGFFYFKDYYYGPADNLLLDTNYYTMVTIEDESYYKFFTGLTAPVITGELWDLIASEVAELNYIPRAGIRLFGRSGFWGLTWGWWFGIFGGAAVLGVAAFIGSRFRR